MKNNPRYLSFLLLLCPVFLFAQNWQPLAIGNRYNYRQLDSAAISHVLLVDSTAQLGNATVFYLNRVVAPCGSCPQASVLRNQGQFFQKEMVSQPNGDVWCYGKDTLLLKPGSGPGTVWWFDSQHQVQAQCLGVALETVFGQPDSVKTIALTAQATGEVGEIRLSKQYGMLRFENPASDDGYELEGIEGMDLGGKLPGLFDFFDWEVGDVFQWRYDGFGGFWSEFATIKTTILDKVQTADSIHYFVSQGRFVDPVFMDFGQYWYHVALPTQPDSMMFDYYYLLPNTQPSWLSMYPGQLAHIWWHSTDQQPTVFSTSTSVRFFEDPVYGPTKLVGNRFGDASCPVYTYDEANEEMPCDSDCIFWEQYSVGLGRTWRKISCPNLNTWGEGKLTGFIKNGVATGVITPDWKFTATEEASTLADVQILPNPTRGECSLWFGQPTTVAIELELLSAAGKMYQRTVLPANTKAYPLDLSKLPQGIYIVKMLGGRRQTSIRLVKL